MRTKLRFNTLLGMKRNLRKCGIDVKNFDRVSSKTLRELFEECENGEIALYYDGKKVWRNVPHTVQVIVIVADRYYYQELYRVRNDKVIVKHQSTSASETLKRGEDPVYTAIRCLAEEFGVYVNWSQVSPIAEWRGLCDTDEPIVAGWRHYASTAYEGIWTRVNILLYRVDLDVMPWQEEVRTLYDNGTQIVVRRLDKHDPPYQAAKLTP